MGFHVHVEKCTTDKLEDVVNQAWESAPETVVRGSERVPGVVDVAWQWLGGRDWVVVAKHLDHDTSVATYISGTPIGAAWSNTGSSACTVSYGYGTGGIPPNYVRAEDVKAGAVLKLPQGTVCVQNVDNGIWHCRLRDTSVVRATRLGYEPVEFLGTVQDVAAVVRGEWDGSYVQ